MTTQPSHAKEGVDDSLRVPRLYLFLSLYADLPPEWQERVEREVRAA